MYTAIKPLNIDLSRLGEKTTQAITELGKDFPIKSDAEGIPVIFKKTDTPVISATLRDGLFEIAADSAPHFYFALSVLLLNSQTIEDSKLYSKPEAQKLLEFRKEHSFTRNGLMLDLSSNAVARISLLKRLIRELAFMGHSWFMLYMEDIYEVEGEPYFGALRGRYSIQDLQALDRYAQLFGLTLVPCIQSLAHLDQFFMWESAAYKYKDIDNILNTGNAEVQALLTRMIASLRKAFSTDIIHIGMDEAHNIGRGRYLNENGLKTKPHIMQEHLSFMQNLCEEYHFQPIIWGDMFFKGYSNVQEDTAISIPDSVGVMYWDYDSSSSEYYSEQIRYRRSIARQTMFAGGAWRWTGYIPHHQKTLETTRAALTACRQEHVQNVIIAAWGDDGSESPLYTGMFGASLYAYLDCHPEYRQAEFAQYLRLYTGIGFDEWMRQGEPDLFEGTTGKNYDITPSKYLLYQDPLNSKFLHYIATLTTDMDALYTRLDKAFMQDAAQTADSLQKHVAEFYSLMMRALSYKWRLPLTIWEAYHTGNKQALQTAIDEKLAPLQELLPQLAQARRLIWMDECKGFGSEVLDHRFGAMTMRLDATKRILTDYIRGAINSIDELEEARLDPCPDADKTLEPQAVYYNHALRIMTACRETW